MCDHDNFSANVTVNRITDKTPMRFTADVTVWCMDCGQAFGFVGLPKAISTKEPCMSALRTTASLPLEPIDVRVEASAGGTMRVDMG